MKQFRKSEKYIVIKDGTNIGLIFGVFAILLSAILFLTSNLWLPDDREIMKKNNDTELNFTMNTIKGIKTCYQDLQNFIGEISFEEIRSSEKEEYNMSYIIYDDKGVKLPLEIIKSDKIQEEDSIKVKQKILLQFRLPKDFYYVKIVIEQKNDMTQEVIFDYRNMENKNIVEKGKDYLVNLGSKEKKLNEIKSKKEVLESKIKENDVKAKDIKANEQDKIKLETENKAYQEELTKINIEYDNLSKELIGL